MCAALFALILLVAVANGLDLCTNTCFLFPVSGNTDTMATAMHDILLNYATVVQPAVSVAFAESITSCNSSSLPVPDTLDEDECYQCCTTIDLLTEDERWRMLFYINENLNGAFFSDIAAAVGQPPSFIKYVTADIIPEIDAECEDLSYPRICRLDLSSVQSSTIPSSFYFTMALNTTSEMLTFRGGYKDSLHWFGVAFSTDQIEPQPMVGYAMVWTTGFIQGLSSMHEFSLDGVSPGLNTQQSSQDLQTFVTSVVDGIFTVEYSREFVTGDSDDYMFYGNETNITIFAAVSSILNPDLPTFSTHSDENLLRPFGAYLVPDPSTDATFWCDQNVIGDCIIEFDVNRSTLAPTALPTAMPELIITTEMLITTTTTNGAKCWEMQVMTLILIVMCVCW